MYGGDTFGLIRDQPNNKTPLFLYKVRRLPFSAVRKSPRVTSHALPPFGDFKDLECFLFGAIQVGDSRVDINLLNYLWKAIKNYRK